MEEDMEDNGDPFDHWRGLISSPQAHFTSFDAQFSIDSLDCLENGGASKVGEIGGFDGDVDVSGPDFGKSKIGASIAERRAAKFGFNASRINTARFRTTSPLASPAARSPYLTIPPGISPTALLDSPIMLSNSQPSPTTGNFSLPPLNHESLMMNSVAPATDGDRDAGSFFRFMPKENPVAWPSCSASENQGLGADVDYQTLAPGKLPVEFEFPARLLEEGSKPCAVDSHTDIKVPCCATVKANCIPSQTSQSDDQMPQQSKPVHREDAGMHHILEGEQKEACSLGLARTSEDGYNWRKYGQKQVKGSEYPRSYYKCTHPNCQVKKKVERSLDGQITEIIYKGAHNHPKPQPTRRTVLGSAFSCNEMLEMGEGNGSCVKIEGGSVWRNIQQGSREFKAGSEWRADGLERTSSTSVITELSDPLSTTQGKSVCMFDSAETPELSSTPASHDDDDRATQGSVSLGDDANDDESDSKRRKTENCLIETNVASRAVREPRVVVQIESEIDILDDGYRWRKYGQKVVKGNPNPRSYYKCTSAGCSVRKHVERASHNLKCVITTYEGKHNHEIPAARNSNVNSNAGNLPPSAASGLPTLPLPRTGNMPKTETQVQDLAPHFERKPEFSHEFLRPSFLGSLGTDMKFGASPMYLMKFPPLQNSLSFGSFELNPNHTGGTHQAVLSTLANRDIPMLLPSSLPGPGNLALPGVDFSSHGKGFGPVPAFLAGQSNGTDVRFIRPKQEQKDENPYDARLPIADHVSGSSSSSSSSLFHQMMGGFSS